VGLGRGTVESVVSDLSAFWARQRVLITGHTGFKGAWLWQVLRALKAQPFGIGLPPETEPALANLCGITDDANSHIVDVRDKAATTAAVKSIAPEVVVHMAAQSLVRRSYVLPVDTFATNVMGTVNILEAVRQTPSVRALLVVTSDKCYLNREWTRPYREDDSLGGYDPYSGSKAAAEIAVASWRDSFFRQEKAAVATARAGNVIGGGDWAAERLIPDCVRAFMADRPVEIRNTTAVRPWQYVLDPLMGYLTLVEKMLRDPEGNAEAWNFGPADADIESVEHVVATFARCWGGSARWTPSPGAHPHEAQTLRIDAAKARERLGWRPRLDLSSAITWSADWYRRCAGGEPASVLCDEQIAAYLARELIAQ